MLLPQRFELWGQPADFGLFSGREPRSLAPESLAALRDPPDLFQCRRACRHVFFTPPDVSPGSVAPIRGTAYTRVASAASMRFLSCSWALSPRCAQRARP